MFEEFKPYPNDVNYLISNFGRIKSLKTKTLLKQFKVSGRYMAVNLSINGRRNRKYVHSLVCETFIGIKTNKQVNHIDGNKLNNSLYNLEYVSAKENVNHAHKLGLCKVRKGIKHHNAKLEETDILNIRKERGEGVSASSISKKYNISLAQVYRIINKENWNHV